jgi:DNA-binding HxlR family transcriptional regulator
MSRQPDPYTCDVSQTIRLIGGKWKAIIIFHLMEDEVLRFGQLQRAVPDITQRMLTLQLRELERDGIVKRTVYQQIPPKVEYTLTPLGKSLTPIISNMKSWGHSYKTNRTELMRAK